MTKLHRKHFLRKVWMYLVILVAGASVGYFSRHYILEPVSIEGNSMYPTLEDGERKFLNKLTPPKRFDIIVFHANDREDYIKRLIGLPGDTVRVEHDTLYINGKKVNEPYISESGFLPALHKLYGDIPFTTDFDIPGITEGRYTKIPKGYYLVLGDNRLRSADSRELGLIKKEDVVGKLFTFNKGNQEKRSSNDLNEHAKTEIEQ